MIDNKYVEICDALNRAGVRYLIVGGVAVALHGVARMTFDIDIIIGLTAENLSKFWQALDDLGYRPRLPVSLGELSQPENVMRWREEKNLQAITFWHPAENIALPLDLVVDHSLDFEAAYLRRRELDYSGIRLPVASKNDLIEMKSRSERDKDRLDVRLLGDE